MKEQKFPMWYVKTRGAALEKVTCAISHQKVKISWLRPICVELKNVSDAMHKLTSANDTSGKVDLESSRFKVPVDSLISLGCLLGLRLSKINKQRNK